MVRRLHIGGSYRCDGWEVLDANPAPHVDHVCNAANLSLFNDASFDEVYASHVLEHFDYQDELLATLQEWKRVLRSSGKLYVSVPDLDVLAGLYLDKERNTTDERFFLMRMIFGGHVDAYDFHKAGLNEEFLASYLLYAGFENIRRVDAFGLFNDSSSATFKDQMISLNLIAERA